MENIIYIYNPSVCLKMVYSLQMAILIGETMVN